MRKCAEYAHGLNAQNDIAPARGSNAVALGNALGLRGKARGEHLRQHNEIGRAKVLNQLTDTLAVGLGLRPEDIGLKNGDVHTLRCWVRNYRVARGAIRVMPSLTLPPRTLYMLRKVTKYS